MHATVHLSDDANFILPNDVRLAQHPAQAHDGNSADAVGWVFQAGTFTPVFGGERLVVQEAFVGLAERHCPGFKTVVDLTVLSNVASDVDGARGRRVVAQLHVRCFAAHEW